MCKVWTDAKHEHRLSFLHRPEVMTGEAFFEGMHQSWGRFADGPLLLYPRSCSGRCGVDMTLPPSYDQAVTGLDNATTLEGGESASPRQPLLQYTLPPLYPPPPPPPAPLGDTRPHPLLSQPEDGLPPYTVTPSPMAIVAAPALLPLDQRN